MLLWIGIGLILLAVAIAAYVFDNGDAAERASTEARIRASIDADAQRRVRESRLSRERARGF